MMLDVDPRAVLHSLDTLIASLETLKTVVAALLPDSIVELVPAAPALLPAAEAPAPPTRKQPKSNTEKTHARRAALAELGLRPTTRGSLKELRAAHARKRETDETVSRVSPVSPNVPPPTPP